jgi:lysophospholipase L1-like esterase
LRLSNEYGDEPLDLEAVSVGLAGQGVDAVPGSLRRATFAGKNGITIPAGAPVLSDPVELPVKPLGDLIVSVYIPKDIGALAAADSPGDADEGVKGADATLAEHLSGTVRIVRRPIVSEINVLTDRPRKVVVTLGDSITDGFGDNATGERGWPGTLARRLDASGIAVVNAGIGGNRLVRSTSFFGRNALSRFDQDVISVPGLSHLIVLEGINDIGMSGPGGMFGDTPLANPDELIAALKQIAARAHARSIKVFAATILPFQGADYYSEEKERIRKAVNEWIRTSRAFDGFIDFDAATRDPAMPGRLKADYDSGDHLHPNAAGYRAMGNVVDLHLFD